MQIGFLIFLNDNETINKRIKGRYTYLTLFLFLELLLDNLALRFNGFSSDWVIPMKLIKATEFTTAMFLPMFLSNIIVRRRFWEKFIKR